MSPQWYAATKAALDDGTGRIISSEAYIARKAPGAISHSGLDKQIGSWRQVAQAFGLRYEPTHGAHKPQQPAQARNCPSEDPLAIAELEAQILEEDARLAQSLPACRIIESEREVRYVLR